MNDFNNFSFNQENQNGAFHLIKKMRHFLLGKIHLIFTVPILTAGAYFIYILKEKGILDKLERYMTDIMSSLVDVSKTCTYYLPDIYAFIECAGRF